MHQIDVELEEGGYAVRIERGLLQHLGEQTRAVAAAETALLVVDGAIAADHGAVARSALERAGYFVERVVVEARESIKTLPTVGRLYESMLAAEMQRICPVVALGGGIIGDTAGFAAATFHRGVPLVNTPTTLLAMVDASIGGKTGVNHPLPDDAGLGKNLIGSFWQPRLVVIDPDVLDTLDDRDYRCGMAECIKHALLDGEPHLVFLEDNQAAIIARQPDVVDELIRRSVNVKVGIVQRDVREAGPRALLNLGHTFAHAIEAAPSSDLRHGEAVAVGLCGAAFVAARTGRLDAAAVERVERLVAAFGLPTRLPADTDNVMLTLLMAFDKKAAGAGLRLVLPAGIGRAELVDDVDSTIVADAWTHLAKASG